MTMGLPTLRPQTYPVRPGQSLETFEAVHRRIVESDGASTAYDSSCYVSEDASDNSSYPNRKVFFMLILAGYSEEVRRNELDR